MLVSSLISYRPGVRVACSFDTTENEEGNELGKILVASFLNRYTIDCGEQERLPRKLLWC